MRASSGYYTRWIDWLGVGGVFPDETEQALTLDKILRWPLLLIAFWLPLEWHLYRTGVLSLTHLNICSWLIWFAFVFETVTLTWLVRDKKRYLLSNWTSLIIIASILLVFWMHSPMSVILRLLRLIIIPRLLITWWMSR